MLLIALLLVGIAMPLASSSARALLACGVLAAILFVAVAALGETTTEAGSMIGAVGVVTIGLLIGAVARSALFRHTVHIDQAIRKTLPRELPPRYR